MIEYNPETTIYITINWRNSHEQGIMVGALMGSKESTKEDIIVAQKHRRGLHTWINHYCEHIKQNESFDLSISFGFLGSYVSCYLLTG
jgi:hypothetical protein